MPDHAQTAEINSIPSGILPVHVFVSLADRWLPVAAPGVQRTSSFKLAFAVAASVHLFVAVLILPTRGTIIGDVSGLPESVTVELLDAKDFDRRRQATLDPASDRIDARSDAVQATPQPEQQSQSAPDSPPAKAQSPPPAPQQATASEAKSLVDALATPLDSAFQVPGKQSLDLAVKLPPVGSSIPRSAKSTERQVSAAETYIDRKSRGQRSAAGVNDEFTRTILRILQQSRPVSHGATGRLVVGFGVTVAGFMEGLHLVESSGQPKLDKMVLDALRQVELVTPPASATLRDRTFEVTYVYDRTSGRVGF